jgi:uncharacterized membrane protein YgdD (TMEM256/DUF423 family)
MVKLWLVLAAALGCLSVGLGAFGAHSLKDVLGGYGRSIWEKAVLYQMFNTVALFVVGLCQLFFRTVSFSMAGLFFGAGILLFSGSLYLLAITGVKWLGAVTPIGGIALLLGWVWLGFQIIRARF